MTNLLKQLLTYSTEDNTGTTQEIELVHYYRLEDISSVLTAFSLVEQEQWEIKIPKSEDNLFGGSFRVRKEVRKGEDICSYYSTVKTVVPGQAGRKEVCVEVTKDFFDSVKGMANKGMCKIRATFPIPGTEGTWKDSNAPYNGALFWEVDVFPGEKEGEFFPWVKVDLESPEVLSTVPEFPLAYTQAITALYGKRTEEEEALVSGFYQGPFVAKHTETNES